VCSSDLSEAVGLDVDDATRLLGDDDLGLRLIGKGDKERAVYLNAACKYAIEQYMHVRPREKVRDKNALFLSKRGQRISKSMVQHIVKQSLGLAGIDTDKYSTHKLRHTAATLMYQHGHVDIRALQEILGHESVATTEIYTHLDSRQLREAVESNPLSDFHLDSASARAASEVTVDATGGTKGDINA
jgi:site-specific recombinase XerD